MSDSYELEAKYQVGEAGCQLLRSLEYLDAFKRESSQSIHQTDTYYDAPDLALRHQSASLRIRRAGEHTFLTYKGPRQTMGDKDHIVRRREEEIQLDGSEFEGWSPSRSGTPATMPAPARLALRHVDIQTMIPIATIDTLRDKCMFADADGSRVELAIDHTTGTRLSDGRQVTFDEIEVEALNVSDDEFAGLLGYLEQLVPGLTPGGPSKLKRTLD